jgi:endogenous inhibitor of DNA gyrase (YacG/DUF329 family)
MIQGRCPICSKSYAIAAIDDLPSFPFCSARCRLVDLGRWADEAYTIPGPTVARRPTTEPAEASDDDSEWQ